MWSTKAALRASGAAVLVLTALTACAPESGTKPKLALNTPTEQFSAQVDEAPDQVALAPHADGLSMKQQAAVVALVSRWRTSPGAGDFAVQAPAADRQTAARTSAEVVAALRNLGVPEQRIRIGDYDAPPGAPVLASYRRLEAQVGNCRDHWDNLTSTKKNDPSSNFGCSVTANFAAMVADPRDILAPAAVEPGDGGRRDVVLGKYRSGQNTSTALDTQANGAVSKAIN
jgi:pilus assembly protein CpaD